MTAGFGYDDYLGRKDRTLYLATLPGAKLPAHLRRLEAVARRSTPVHSDATTDIAAKGYRFFSDCRWRLAGRPCPI